MAIRNWWNRKSKGEKAFIIFFCLLCLFSSNIVEIRGGYCSSSPCGQKEYFDHYGSVIARPLLNPTSFLLPLILKSTRFSLDYFLFENNAFGVSYIWNKHLLISLTPISVLTFDFDKTFLSEKVSDRESKEYQEYMRALKRHDGTWLPIAYIMAKFVLLLSFPWWLWLSHVLLKIRKKNMFIFYALLLYLLITGLWMFVIYLFEHDYGNKLVTWSYLYGAIMGIR